MEDNKRKAVEACGVCIVKTCPMNYTDMTGLPCRVVAEI